MTPAGVEVDALLAVGVVVGAARACGAAASRFGQPRILGEILAGIALGPGGLGLVWPDAFAALFPADVVGALEVLALLGVVLFMFLVGLELDLTRLRGQGHRAVVISQASIVAPFAMGSALGLALHPRLGGEADRLGFALFMGAAMAITAFPVLARLLQETGLSGSRIGVLCITCAAVDDVTAWCLLAAVVTVAGHTGPGDTVGLVMLAGVFLVAMLRLARPALARLARVPLWCGVVVAFVAAWTTEQIGVHAVFGAFIAGVVMPRNPQAVGHMRAQLEPVVLTLLLPVFFVVVGLDTRIDLLGSPYLIGVTVGIVAVAIAGKLGGSLLAARLVGETWRDATLIGVLLNTRGLTELVILSVGLRMGVITPVVFTVMVIMALVTTFMAVPLVGLLRPSSDPGPAGDRALHVSPEP